MELLESYGDKTNKKLLHLATRLAQAAFVTLLRGPHQGQRGPHGITWQGGGSRAWWLMVGFWPSASRQT